MAELNDVLGAILRDVAQARVMSDLFSRNVSVDYQQDDVLGGFPVPRVEVTQASLDLKFAVSAVEHKPVDPDGVIRSHVAPFATQLARQVYSDLVATNPRSEELEEIIKRKGLAIEADLTVAIERTIADNRSDLESAMANKIEALARKVQGEVAERVLADDDVKEVMTRGTRIGELREHVSVIASAFVDSLVRAAPAPTPAPTQPGEGAERPPVSPTLLAGQAVRLGERVYADVVLANPRRPELLNVTAEAGIRLDRELRETAERVLLEDPEATAVALAGRPDALVERLESELVRTITERREIRDVFTRRTRVTDIKTRIATLVTSSLASFARDLRTALDAAERQALSVDVAVTTEELASLPETMVSRLNVVSEIRNYEWVTVAENGTQARRLQPE